MCSHFWNKLITVSAALLAAGILVCAVAIADVLIPKGSPATFLANATFLGLVVAAVVIGYT